MDFSTISDVVRLAWLAGASCFVLGLMRMNSPATARNGNLLSAGGMAVAIAATAILLFARPTAEGGANGTGWAIMVAAGRIVTVALAAITVVGALFLWAGNLSVPVMLLILAAALVFGVTMV